MKKQKVILTRGLIAAEKSTWAKDFIKKYQDYKRVCRDSLRHMLSNYIYNKVNEKLVTKVIKYAIKEIIEFGYNIIIDEAHLNEKSLNKNIS